MAKFSPVDIVEVAYDLQVDFDAWVPRLLEVGRSLLDHGHGVVAAVNSGFGPNGEATVSRMYVDGDAPELPMRLARTMQEGGERIVQTIRFGAAASISESRASQPEVVDIVTRCFGSKDVFGFWPIDPDMHGLTIAAPASEVLSISPKAGKQWDMLGAHVAAGHRLRRGLSDTEPSGVPMSELPLRAEAVVDPKHFRVTEAVGDAQGRSSVTELREQAVQLDRARGRLRREDSDEALAIWKGLVQGRWSLLDWFDSDGRRFLLAKPNPPRVKDPRGLTKREAQASAFVALGHSNQSIAYRFGFSEAYVSQLVASLKRKLRAETRMDLVTKLRALQSLDRGNPEPHPEGDSAGQD